MSFPADRREFRRAHVGSEFRISFSVKGQPFQDVRITNLGAGGCFALVGAREAPRFERGTPLERLMLLHPELPMAPIRAVVSYVLAHRPGLTPLERVGLGIQFLDMDPAAQEALATWVDAACASGRG